MAGYGGSAIYSGANVNVPPPIDEAPRWINRRKGPRPPESPKDT